MASEDPVPVIDDYDAAVAFLDERVARGVRPGLERTEGVLSYLADPHTAYSTIHVAGTNGKTTVARMVDAILGSHGLRTGTFTSPHLRHVEQRFAIDGATMSRETFVAAVRDIAWFVEEYERREGEGPTYFEMTTLVALSAFAEAAVDVAIVEVGLGGRLDSTNVIDANISVITGIAVDHTAMLGHTVSAIAGEKVAILKDRGTLVTGPLPAATEGVVTARVAETASRWLRSGDDFGVESAVPAVGGWSASMRGVYDDYEDLYMPLHGRHQVDNLATAIAASEALVEHALDLEALRAATSAMTSPGRIEVVGRHPLVVIDGAHNAQSLAALAETLVDEFPPLEWQLVLGLRGDRDVEELLEPFRSLLVGAIVTEPDDPAAIPAERVATGVRAALGIDVAAIGTVPDALEAAMEAAGADGGVLVTGSLYVAGEARAAAVGEEIKPAGVHVRLDPPVDVGIEEEDAEG
jgi:dihydrofolate synthase/folylpolyglutamate synthase